jgi:secondary thiamine-phosphate synthase enzyme
VSTALYQEQLTVATPHRGLHDITSLVRTAVARSSIQSGLCHLFIRHTSASLIIQENADPDVKRDLDAFFARLVPDGDPLFIHTDEGPDDMSAHVRSVLTNVSLSIPILQGQLALGTWQGIYVWEHRTRAHRRNLIVSVQGTTVVEESQ